MMFISTRIGKRPAWRCVRDGNVMVLAVIFLIVALAFLAFAIDVGGLALTRSSMQNSADAACRSAARYLPAGIDKVEEFAKKYAEENLVAEKPAPLKLDEDLEIGVWSASTREFYQLDRERIADANAVRIFIRLTDDRNNSANLFIAPLLGIHSAELNASATAAIETNIRGFKSPREKKHHPILPFTVDLESWDEAYRGTGTDWFGFDSDQQRVHGGPDQIPELNIFPQGNNAPGNRGYLSLGRDPGSNSTIQRQIINGLAKKDFDVMGGLIDLGENSSMTLQGRPGVRTSHERAFDSIIGEVRIIPIFRNCSGNGADATYEIVKWVGARIMHVNFNGSPKQILVQPADVWLDKSSIIIGNGNQSSNSIYTKPKLVD